VSITSPAGFRAAGVACGIKAGGLDLALVASDEPAAAAAVFTTNEASAAPVAVSRRHAAGGRARGVVVNSGCANAATGRSGEKDALAMAACTAEALGCAPEEVLVASTGVIGVPLPMDKVRAGIVAAAAALSPTAGDAAARAIMTTDQVPKQTEVEFELEGRVLRVGAMAKGAGMIAPHMATMLAFFTTDAAVDTPLLQRALRTAVGESLNRISVDGDTSTNDMALVLANGAADAPPIDRDGDGYRAFEAALTEASRRMALAIVRDGEGATRVAEVRVEGARSTQDADRIARTVGESLLVKTALFGRDPNWGRVLAALGRAGVPFDLARVELRFGDVCVFTEGTVAEYEEPAARASMDEDPVRLLVRLAEGTAESWLWTCDLGHGYVDINASYRT